MSAFKQAQRHLNIGGRLYHFVSYEATPGNPRRQEEAQPAMWYLMVEGRRRAAFPCDPDHSEAEVDKALTRWVAANARTPTPSPKPAPAVRSRRRTTWWGPN